MPDINEVEQALLRGKKEKQLNIPWWNIVRRAEYQWKKDDFFSHTIPSPDIWIFEESRKEYFSVIVLLGFALFTSLLPLLVIVYGLTQSTTFDDTLEILLIGVVMLCIVSIVSYIFWTSFFDRLFSLLSHKKIVLNRQTGTIVLEYHPWLYKTSHNEIPFSSLQLLIDKEFTSDGTILHCLIGETEFTNLHFFRSSDRIVVEQFYSRLNSFLQG